MTAESKARLVIELGCKQNRFTTKFMFSSKFIETGLG